jgi:hypothetical protein
MTHQWLVLVNVYVECETAQEAEDSVLQSLVDGRNYVHAKAIGVHSAPIPLKKEVA